MEFNNFFDSSLPGGGGARLLLVSYKYPVYRKRWLERFGIINWKNLYEECDHDLILLHSYEPLFHL